MMQSNGVQAFPFDSMNCNGTEQNLQTSTVDNVTKANSDFQSMASVAETMSSLVEDIVEHETRSKTSSSQIYTCCPPGAKAVCDNVPVHEHSMVLLTNVQQLKSQGLLLDTCITCSGQSILAHLAVLVSYSRYFHKILLGGIEFNSERKYQIQLDNMLLCFPVVEWIIDYMYNGVASIPPSHGAINTETVLHAATILDMPQLLAVLENKKQKTHCSTNTLHSTNTLSARLPIKSHNVNTTDLDYLDGDDSDYIPSETEESAGNKQSLRPRRKSARTLKTKTCRVTNNTRKATKIKKGTSNEDRTYKCYHCDLSYSHRKSMHDHVRATHTDISKPFPCRGQHCDFHAINPREVQRHVTQCHPELVGGKTAENRSIRCYHCDAVYSHIKTMQNHIRSVHGDIEKPFICDVTNCNFAAKENKELYQHKMELHFISKLKMVSTLSLDQIKGRKVFSCTSPGCGYKTVNRKSIKCHQRRHEGILPYQCTYCDKAFVERKSLKGHETTHTGEKNHKCNFCVQTFGLRKSLVEHIRNVHKNIENPFICPHRGCEFASESNRQLYAHRLEAHRSDLVQTKKEKRPTATLR